MRSEVDDRVKFGLELHTPLETVLVVKNIKKKSRTNFTVIDVSLHYVT